MPSYSLKHMHAFAQLDSLRISHINNDNDRHERNFVVKCGGDSLM